MDDGEQPPPEAPSEAEGFFEALEHGDLGSALAELRNLKCLCGDELQLLADFLDSDPELSRFHAFKLVLERRRSGKPTLTPINQKLLSQERGRFVDRETKKLGKREAALSIASERFGVGRSTLLRDLAHWMRVSRGNVQPKAE